MRRPPRNLAPIQDGQQHPQMEEEMDNMNGGDPGVYQDGMQGQMDDANDAFDPAQIDQ